MNNKIFIENSELRTKFIQFLSDFVYERRVSQLQKVIENRTKYITVVLEDIFQSQNASAVLRTSDCLGIQDIHIIENKNRFNINPKVVLGSAKWLTIKKYNGNSNNSEKAIKKLKEEGYRIVATSPHTNEVSLDQFDINKGKVAIFLGTEQTGLSETVLKQADEYLTIPMFGFTESFNISVSAAIVLYDLTKKLRESNINYQLTKDEQEILILTWLKGITKNYEMMEKRFLQENKLNK